MVTPQDFIHRLKSGTTLNLSITDSGSERVKTIPFPKCCRILLQILVKGHIHCIEIYHSPPLKLFVPHCAHFPQLAVDLFFVSKTFHVFQAQAFVFLSMEHKVHSLHHLITLLNSPVFETNSGMICSYTAGIVYKS